MNNKRQVIGVKVVLLCTLLALTGCNSNKPVKAIKTSDDSADYKSARALPPLNKTLESVERQVEEPQLVTEPAPVIAQSPSAESEQTPDIAASDLTPTETTADLNANIVTVNDRVSRLEIDAEFEAAWQYVTNQLLASGVTIHNRNFSAGRISIGCSGLDVAPVVVKKGGWSIFNRNSKEALEYCALQMVASKQKTFVRVLNRNAQEVDRTAAEQIYQQILTGQPVSSAN